jgi:hypothetical protein
VSLQEKSFLQRKRKRLLLNREPLNVVITLLSLFKTLDSEPADLIIQAELAGNGVALRPVTNDLSSRTRTSASVSWSPEPWEVAGERSARQRTPDLAALIQEVVDRPDWHEGNALVLLISGSGGERGAWSYDGAARSLEHAPRPYIELAEVHP